MCFVFILFFLILSCLSLGFLLQMDPSHHWVVYDDIERSGRMTVIRQCTVIPSAFAFVFCSSLDKTLGDMVTPPSFEAKESETSEDDDMYDEDDASDKEHRAVCFSDEWVSLRLTESEWEALAYVRSKWHCLVHRAVLDGERSKHDADLKLIDAFIKSVSPSERVVIPVVRRSSTHGRSSQYDKGGRNSYTADRTHSSPATLRAPNSVPGRAASANVAISRFVSAPSKSASQPQSTVSKASTKKGSSQTVNHQTAEVKQSGSVSRVKSSDSVLSAANAKRGVRLAQAANAYAAKSRTSSSEAVSRKNSQDVKKALSNDSAISAAERAVLIAQAANAHAAKSRTASSSSQSENLNVDPELKSDTFPAPAVQATQPFPVHARTASAPAPSYVAQGPPAPQRSASHYHVMSQVAPGQGQHMLPEQAQNYGNLPSMYFNQPPMVPYFPGYQPGYHQPFNYQFQAQYQPGVFDSPGYAPTYNPQAQPWEGPQNGAYSYNPTQ